MKASEISNIAAPSFEQQLAGRAAGVQITSNTGILGEAPRVRIRGIASINSGTAPLYIVDGIPIFSGDIGGKPLQMDWLILIRMILNLLKF
ncbi:TonB-dependent receptor plug domain-containing protein [Chryseobacterium sp. 1B4]